MKALTLIFLAALLIGFGSPAQAQYNTLSTTTLTTTVTDSETRWVVGSSASFVAPTTGQNGTVLYLDGEAAFVSSIPDSTHVIVKRGAKAAPHKAASWIYYGEPRLFYSKDPKGYCVTASTFVSPWINTNDGRIWTCNSDGLWVRGEQVGEVLAVTVPVAAPGTIRGFYSAVTLGVSMTSGSIVGARGAVTVPTGKQVDAAYIYGVQGKLTINGTSNTQSTGGILTGVFGQLDLTGSTITNTGDTAAGWFDIGGTGVGGAAAKVMGIGITNSTSTIAGAAIHVATTSGGFSNLFHIDDVSNTLFVSSSGTSSGQCAQSGGLVPAKAIPVMIGTNQYYIPLCTGP